MITLSLVIPTYNESQNIVPLIHQAASVLKKNLDNFEIIIVDDDSPDETWKVAGELAKENGHVRVIRRCNERGLATAVVTGWKAAEGEILGVMDGDLQHPPETLNALLNAMFHKKADIAVASRNMVEGGVREWNILRRWVSWGGALLTAIMLPGILRTVRDPMSGYFFIRRPVIESIHLKPEGYKILLEVLARGSYQTVVEVPYIFNGRKQGGSKFGFKQVLKFLKHLGQLSWETGQLERFVRFCTVGFSGIFVNEGALQLFTEVGGLYYVHSSCLAVELAIMSNFILNEIWTFRDQSQQQSGTIHRLIRFLKFNLICAMGALLNVTTLWALTEWAGLHYLLSNLMGIALSTLWNYGLNSNITWDVTIERKAGNP